MNPTGIIHNEPVRLMVCRKQQLYCLLDWEDYLWAIKWRWHVTPNSSKIKFYATRMTTAGSQQTKVYMHKAVICRAGKQRMTQEQHMVDHINGDSLDNRRENLRWATAKLNARNRRKRR